MRATMSMPCVTSAGLARHLRPTALDQFCDRCELIIGRCLAAPSPSTSHALRGGGGEPPCAAVRWRDFSCEARSKYTGAGDLRDG